MKIFLRNIPDAGLSLNQTVEPHEIGLSEDFFKPLTPLQITARIERADEAVLAKVRVEGKFEFACGRCLEPFQQDRSDELDLYFEIEPKTEDIELGEDIRQEMIVNFSSVILCRDDCRGLCPSCGTNLNNKTCQCDPAILKEAKKPLTRVIK